MSKLAGSFPMNRNPDATNNRTTTLYSRRPTRPSEINNISLELLFTRNTKASRNPKIKLGQINQLNKAQHMGTCKRSRHWVPQMINMFSPATRPENESLVVSSVPSLWCSHSVKFGKCELAGTGGFLCRLRIVIEISDWT